MTQRSMTPAILTEIAQRKNVPIHLYEAGFDSGTLYLTDAGMDISWNGHTYINAGQVIGFDTITESLDFNIANVNVTLSGIPSNIISLFLTEPFIDRPARIYKAMLDANCQVIANPVLIFEGHMDGPALDEDITHGTCNITIPASDEFVDFEAVKGRKTNSTDQNKYFPNDRSFDFVSNLMDTLIHWGSPA